MTAKFEDDYEALRVLCEPFLVTADIRADYIGAVSGYLPMGRCSISGHVFIADGAPDLSPAETRAAQLARAEAFIAALRSAGWVLHEAPRMEFSGRLEHARWLLTGAVVKEPGEWGIDLTVHVGVTREREAKR